ARMRHQIEVFLGRLDTFRHHGNAERQAHGFDGSKNALASRPTMDRADERPVDLELVDRQVRERGERGIAGPEIVDGQTDARLPQQGKDLALQGPDGGYR